MSETAKEFVERMRKLFRGRIIFGFSLEDEAHLLALALRGAETQDEIERLRAALEWYAGKAAGCRRVSSEGNDARRELDRDGGERALAALREPKP